MTQMGAVDSLATVRATALVEHYQKTREEPTRSWEERNQRYIILVGLLAMAALLSFVQGPIVQALGKLSSSELSTLIGKLSTLNNPEIGNIVASFLIYNAAVVFDLLMIVFLVVTFYLMTDLFHRSSMLVTLYVYLSLVETEIRSALVLSSAHVAFTREGSFYRATGRWMSSLIGAFNKGMLGCLLVLFLASRLLVDYPQDLFRLRVPEWTDLAAWPVWARRNLLFLLDVVTVLLTAPMFLGYLRLRPPTEAKVRETFAEAVRQS